MFLFFILRVCVLIVQTYFLLNLFNANSKLIIIGFTLYHQVIVWRETTCSCYFLLWDWQNKQVVCVYIENRPYSLPTSSSSFPSKGCENSLITVILDFVPDKSWYLKRWPFVLLLPKFSKHCTGEICSQVVNSLERTITMLLCASSNSILALTEPVGYVKPV